MVITTQRKLVYFLLIITHRLEHRAQSQSQLSALNECHVYATLLRKVSHPLPPHTHMHMHTPIVEEYLVEKALVHSLMRKLDLPTYEFPTTRILKT